MKSKRFQQEKSDGPDPGQYGPLGSAFAPPSRGPSATFGSKSRRDLFDKPEEDAPAPGSYVHKGDTLGWAAQKQRFLAVPSAAFADKSGRFEKASARAPDPGSYYNAKSSANIAAVHARGTFGKSAARGASGFGSSSAREQRVFDKTDVEDAPGPGAYDQREPLGQHNASVRGGSAFASKSERMHARKSDAPGVGAYDAYASGSLAQSATKSHNKSAGSFGSKAPMLWEQRSKEQPGGPGPESYGQEHHTLKQKTQGSRGHMSSSFASNSIREAGFLGVQAH